MENAGNYENRCNKKIQSRKGCEAIAGRMMDDPPTNGHRPASKETNTQMLIQIQIQVEMVIQTNIMWKW